ncbi:HNH endonuclease [Nonomuraea glycinis]|uniref:HNH endonuclease n=1 Tax=Nonomuraea glycinis TaxID=2047744 RepID=UPI00389AF3EE
MPQGRSPIPAALKRELLVEAGHRCAIPTCRAPAPLEFEHIEEWAKVKRHDFANMIVLCANCHGRKGSGPNQIDRKSLHQYKANLSLVNSRYGELERRVLTYYAQRPDLGAIWLPSNMQLLMMFLLQDGYFARDEVMDVRVRTETRIFSEIEAVSQCYVITDKGMQFVKRWAAALPLE